MLATFAFAIVVVWNVRVIADARIAAIGSFDLFAYFYPMQAYGAAELRAGRLPLWNPHQLAGIPALATLQPGYLYPPHLVYLFLPTHTAQAIVTLLHVMLAACAAYLLCRALSLTRIAALLGGIAYAFTGALPWLTWPPMLAAHSWCPLGLTALYRVFAGDRRWLSLVTLSVAMPMLAGGAQSVAYVLYAYAIFSMTTLTGSLPRLSRADIVSVALLAVAVATGLGIAAPQLLPTLELAGQGARSMAPLEARQMLPYEALAYSPARLLEALIVPNGELQRIALGAVTLALAAGGLLRKSPMTVACFAFFAWGLLAAMAPPWYLELQRSLPALAWFRIPDRAFFLAQLGAAVLAAQGLDLLSREASRMTRFAVAAIAAAILVYATIARVPAGAALVTAGAALCVAALALVRTPSERIRAVLAGALTLLLASDLVGFSRNVLLLPYAHGAWRGIYDLQPVVQRSAVHAHGARYLLLGKSHEAAWTPKTATLFRHFSPIDYDPLAIRAYGDFFEFATSGRLQNEKAVWPFSGGFDMDFRPATNRRRQRFLSLLSVRVYAMQQRERDPGLWDFVSRLRPIGDPADDEFSLWEDPQALPRAYAVHNAECIGAPLDRLRRLADAKFDPRSSVVLESDCARLELGETSGSEAVSIIHYEASRVQLKTQMESAGLIVLTDSYYPGWEATVNEKPAPILRANTVVRAVPVPRGEVTLELRYKPKRFYIGILLALVSSCGLIVMASFTRR